MNKEEIEESRKKDFLDELSNLTLRIQRLEFLIECVSKRLSDTSENLQKQIDICK